MSESWFVYIAQARTGRYYTGISQNPNQRLVDHNRGKGAKLAIDQGEFVLRYVSDPFVSKSEAHKREIQIKGWTREKKEKLIRGEWV
jgi:putative endonuclease